MQEQDILIAKLDELITVQRAACMPLRERWLQAEDAAALIGYSVRSFRENLACKPSFPKPLRADGIGNPRWKASEILQWAEDQRNGKGLAGRPRKAG